MSNESACKMWPCTLLMRSNETEVYKVSHLHRTHSTENCTPICAFAAPMLLYKNGFKIVFLISIICFSKMYITICNYQLLLTLHYKASALNNVESGKCQLFVTKCNLVTEVQPWKTADTNSWKPNNERF